MHLYRKYIKQGLAFLLLLLIVCSCVPNVHATEDSESRTEEKSQAEDSVTGLALPRVFFII